MVAKCRKTTDSVEDYLDGFHSPFNFQAFASLKIFVLTCSSKFLKKNNRERVFGKRSQSAWLVNVGKIRTPWRTV